MPSRESVSEEIRARTEFVAAVRTGIDALMGRCGYSRERAVHALLKELNRAPPMDQDSGGNNNPASAWGGKPTDNEIFDAMRKHKLGIDGANRAITVSRAMRREMLSRNDTTTTTVTTLNDNHNYNDTVAPSEAIHRLMAKISLDTILYESGDDDSDDDDSNETKTAPLKLPKIGRVSSSSSIGPTGTGTTSNNNNTSTTTNTNISTTTTHSTATNRKNARSKKITSPSPRKQPKTSHGSSRNKNNNSSNGTNNNSNNNNNSNTILVGKKRGIDEMDASTASAEVETKAATGRPLRASKRLHRASNNSASTTAEPPTVNVGNSGLNMNTMTMNTMNMNANK